MMDIKIDTSGVEKKLKDLENKARKLEQGTNISFEEMFNPQFMMKYTQFSNFDEMLNKSGFKVETKEDFEAIDDSEWDEYVQKTTQFTNWQEMLNEAGALWAAKQLGF